MKPKIDTYGKKWVTVPAPIGALCSATRHFRKVKPVAVFRECLYGPDDTLIRSEQTCMACHMLIVIATKGMREAA